MIVQINKILIFQFKSVMRIRLKVNRHIKVLFLIFGGINQK